VNIKKMDKNDAEIIAWGIILGGWGLIATTFIIAFLIILLGLGALL